MDPENYTKASPEESFQNQADGWCEAPSEVVERIVAEELQHMAKCFASQDEPVSHGA